MSTDLILALDVPTREEAAPLLRQLRGSLKWVKIGLQIFTAYGPDYVRAVADEGFNVFLDLKLHDIPNTVAKAHPDDRENQFISTSMPSIRLSKF